MSDLIQHLCYVLNKRSPTSQLKVSAANLFRQIAQNTAFVTSLCFPYSKNTSAALHFLKNLFPSDKLPQIKYSLEDFNIFPQAMNSIYVISKNSQVFLEHMCTHPGGGMIVQKNYLTTEVLYDCMTVFIIASSDLHLLLFIQELNHQKYHSFGWQFSQGV